MVSKYKDTIEFRYYEIPNNEPLLVLMGDKWIHHYGETADDLHFHNLLEIGYCHYGNGSIILGKEEYRYETGTLTAIPKNISHTTISDEFDISFWEYLFIDVEQTICEIYSEETAFERDFVSRINQQGLISNESENPRIATLIKAIFDEMKNKREFYRESTRSLSLSLLLEIARSHSDKTSLKKPNEQGKMLIKNALDYINVYYSQSIKIGELAEVCYMSETNFRRRFKEIMNMTPVEYINLVRIQKACELMTESNNSMKKIAIEVGFQSSSTFYRNFKKIIGQSPHEWKSNADNYDGKLLNCKITAKKGW